MKFFFTTNCQNGQCQNQNNCQGGNCQIPQRPQCNCNGQQCPCNQQLLTNEQMQQLMMNVLNNLLNK